MFMHIQLNTTFALFLHMHVSDRLTYSFLSIHYLLCQATRTIYMHSLLNVLEYMKTEIEP